MSDNNIAASQRQRQQEQVPFRLSTMVAAIGTAVSIMAAGPLYAADDKIVTELQAEIANLKQALEKSQKEKQALEKSQQELAAQKTAQPAPTANEAVVADAATAAADSKNDEPQSLETAVIRSRNRIERLHDVPLSVSTVSGKELNRELAQDLSAITKRAANVTFNQNNTRGASLSVRGLGKGRAFQETQDPSVGMIVDGVSYGLNSLANFDFYDVDSVDVTRGPQGTLGGKGGSTGVVSINTKRPSFTPSADYELTYGQRDTVIAKSNFGGAVIDDLLAWRGSFIVDKARGYYESSYDPNYSFYNKDRVSGRTQFLLTPTENLTARISFDLEPKAPQVQNGLTFRHDQPFLFADGSLTDPSGTTNRAKLVGFTNASGLFTAGRNWFAGRSFDGGGQSGIFSYADNISKKLLQNENQGQTVYNKGASAEVNWNVGSHTLTSITAWRSFGFDAHNDEGTPFDINKNGGGGVIYNQYSQEFRINSEPGGLFDYTAGTFSIKTDDDIVSKTGWGSDAGAWFATTAQYKALDTSAGTDRGSGLALLRDSLADAAVKGDTLVNTNSNALFGQINWHLTEAATLTTGLRVTAENRSSEDLKLLTASGVGAALNPVSVRGVQLGGFNSSSSGALNAGNSAAQLSLADSVANRYFGKTITATPGAAYNSLTSAQQAQVAAAKAIRSGQIGALSSGVKSNYDDTLFTAIISPSYKINENFTAYTSWQHGEKSGSALNINFVSANVKPEKTDAFELGLKSILLDKTLVLNADVFLMNIRDYQTTVRAVDEFTTATNITNGTANPVAYVTAQGNVPLVRAKGVELDGAYSGIANTTIRFSGAYNDARYVDFTKAAFPDELAYLSTAAKPYTDQSGLSLPGAAKWTFNLGPEYRRPVGDKVFHASFNTAFTSRYNNTDTLSSYGWVGAHNVTDTALGISFKSNFDLNFVVKNLFDNRSHEKAWTSYSPDPYPRWIGITFSGKM